HDYRDLHFVVLRGNGAVWERQESKQCLLNILIAFRLGGRQAALDWPSASPPLTQSISPTPRNWAVCKVAGLLSNCCFVRWQVASQQLLTISPTPPSSSTSTSKLRLRARFIAPVRRDAILPKS